jgi:DNA-binding protein HU-beta
VNKFEIIEAVAKSADISKAAAGRALEGTVTAIKASLKKGGMVTLVGFGTFYVGKRAARSGRNPRTGSRLPGYPSSALEKPSRMQ